MRAINRLDGELERRITAALEARGLALGKVDNRRSNLGLSPALALSMELNDKEPDELARRRFQL